MRRCSSQFQKRVIKEKDWNTYFQSGILQRAIKTSAIGFHLIYNLIYNLVYIWFIIRPPLFINIKHSKHCVRFCDMKHIRGKLSRVLFHWKRVISIYLPLNWPKLCPGKGACPIASLWWSVGLLICLYFKTFVYAIPDSLLLKTINEN